MLRPVRLLLFLLLCTASSLAEDLSERQIALLRAALSKDDRDALIRHSDSWGAPALAWIQRYHPKIATWLQHHALCRRVAEHFDRLGPPAWAEKKFVRLTWPRLEMVAKPVASAHRYEHGWLLDERNLTLLGYGLEARRHRLIRDPPVKEVDFEQFCLDVIAKPRKEQPFSDFCSLAYYALRLDHKDLAVRLIAAKYRPALDRSVELLVNNLLRRRIARAAHAGMARTELRELAAKIPGDHLVQQYDSLIAEDEKWVDPMPPELAGMTKEQQARVWVHRLRDARTREDLRTPWEAVPVLIERLEDRRPTRLVVAGTLESHGECCAYALYLHAGRYFDTPADAAAWWADAKPNGAEAQYRALLADRKTRILGVWGLARLDYAKHRGTIIRLCETDPSLIFPLSFEVRDEQLFVGWLKKVHTRGPAAVALWRRFRSDRGAKEIIRAVRARAGNDPPPGMFFLGEIHTEEVATALVEFLQHDDRAIRSWAATAAAAYPHPLIAKALRAQLKTLPNAVIALAILTTFPDDVGLHFTADDVRRVAKWYDDRKDLFDWEELRNDAAR